MVKKIPGQEGTMGTFKNIFGLVRSFWVDFFREAKRGTIAHQKGIKIFLLFCTIGFFLILATMLRFSESSTFCGLCHQMTAYINSWKASSHSHVACTKCHYEPGLFNHLKGKWVDGQVSLAYFISGKKPSRPHAEIGDASCLQTGCHKIENLQGNMIYKNVAFSHGKHLGELRRGMKLRCTSCHAQIVQGLHLTVHETNCFICHYYKAGPKGEEDCLSCSIGGCTSCHFEPKGDIKVKDWNFNHRKYIERGVACEKCHLNVVQGDGHVPEGKCVECHNEPVILSTKYTSQFLHKNHVTGHKIECSGCHTPLRHEIGRIPTLAHASTNCDKCHSKEVHTGPQEMYRGISGIGIPESPSLMFTFNVDCIACHRKAEASQAALHTTRYEEKAIEQACLDCHGEGFDNTLRHWRRYLSRAESETNQKLFNAQKALFDAEKGMGQAAPIKKAQSLLNEARHDYSLVLLGKGAHNIEYAIKLLNVANHKSELALAALDKTYQPQEYKSQITCTTLCHISIEKQTVRFNDIKFSHQTHVLGKGMKCSDCHSPRENHGKTTLKNCVTCHHGKGTPKVSCEDCHIAVKRLSHGNGALGVKERPSIKLNAVTCVDCHTGIPLKKKDPFETIQKNCVQCHDPSYAEKAVQWKNGVEDLLKSVGQKMDQVKKEINRIELKGGHTSVYRKLYGDAEFNFNIVKKGKGIHNPEFAQDLLNYSNSRLDEALKQLSDGKQQKAQGM
jgi:hypothetical protein